MKLSSDFKPMLISGSFIEEWNDYRERLNINPDSPFGEFIFQYVYPSYEDFYEKYPDFTVDDYVYEFIHLSAKEANESVCANNPYESPQSELWKDKYKLFKSEILMNMDNTENCSNKKLLLREMMINKEYRSPPILLDSKNLINSNGLMYGRPLHLIEGTTRFSFLINLAKDGYIDWSSKHKFVIILPK